MWSHLTLAVTPVQAGYSRNIGLSNTTRTIHLFPTSRWVNIVFIHISSDIHIYFTRHVVFESEKIKSPPARHIHRMVMMTYNNDNIHIPILVAKHVKCFDPLPLLNVCCWLVSCIASISLVSLLEPQGSEINWFIYQCISLWVRTDIYDRKPWPQ